MGQRSLVTAHGTPVYEDVANYKPTPVILVDINGHPMGYSSGVGMARETWFTRLNGSGAREMNVNGAVTPQTFSIAPPSGTQYVLTSLTLLVANAGISLTNFCGVGAGAGITNGCLLRIRRGVTTQYDITGGLPLKQTQDLLSLFYAPPSNTDVAGVDMITIQLPISEIWTHPFSLDGTQSDTLQLVVQDDLTAIDVFRISAFGWSEPSV